MAQMAREACTEDDVPECRHLIVMTIDPAAPSPVEPAMTLGQLMHGQPPAFPTHADRAGRHRRDAAYVRHDRAVERRGADALQHDHERARVARHAHAGVRCPARRAQRHARDTAAVSFHRADGADERRDRAAAARSSCCPGSMPAPCSRPMAAERINCWIGVPTMYWTLLQHARKDRRRRFDDRRVPALLRLGRRADAGRGAAGLRTDVRRAHP